MFYVGGSFVQPIEGPPVDYTDSHYSVKHIHHVQEHYMGYSGHQDILRSEAAYSLASSIVAAGRMSRPFGTRLQRRSCVLGSSPVTSSTQTTPEDFCFCMGLPRAALFASYELNCECRQRSASECTGITILASHPKISHARPSDSNLV